MGEALKTSPQKSIGEILKDACPYFMAIGVSYDEYWYKSPLRLKDYLKADEIRQKRKNNDLWLQGYYDYIAFLSVSPVLHAFAKKGAKPLDFPKNPITLTEEERFEIAEKERKARLEKLKEQLLNSAYKNKEAKRNG